MRRDLSTTKKKTFLFLYEQCKINRDRAKKMLEAAHDPTNMPHWPPNIKGREEELALWQSAVDLMEEEMSFHCALLEGR